MTAPTRQTNPGRSRTAWLGALLILITVGIYWPVHRHDFINFDDPDYVTSNPRVQAGLSAESVRWAFTQSHSSNWHPLTWMSHMLDCQLFGLDPAGHHLVNVVFHTTDVLLLFLLLRQMTGAVWRSALVAALFALHPLHIESVAWVAERKDVLSTCFGLLTLMAYVKYTRDSKVQNPKSKVWYGLALLWFALGLLSKPMLVTWPFVLLLLDFWPLQRVPGIVCEMSGETNLTRDTSQLAVPIPPFAKTLRHLLVEKLPFFAMTLASCVVTVIAQRGSGATVPLDALPLGARLAQLPVAYLRYLGKTFWPEDLAVFYPYVNLSWASQLVLVAVVLLVGLTVLIVTQIRSRPFLAVGWLWFLGTMMPVIGLVQVGRQAIADRYTYIPHIGLFVAVVWLAAEVVERIKVPRLMRALGAGLLIAICAGLTSRQLLHWQNTGTLAQQTIRATQDNYIAYAQLAGVLVHERKYDEALAAARMSLQIRPSFAEAHNTLAAIHARQGRTEDAVAAYLEAASHDSTLPDPHHGLAELYQKQGRFADAEQESRTALELAPLHLGATFTLAQALHSQNRLDEAVAAYQRLDALKPGLFSVRYGLGSIHVLKGDVSSALREFETARSLQPTNATVHNSIGVLLLGRGSVMEASNCFSIAATLEPTNALAHFQLANLLTADHQDAKAVTHYRLAVQWQPDQPEALNNFAWLLATSPHDHVRDGPEAVRLAEHACQLTKRQAPFLLGTLAAAYAEAGRFEDAIVTASRARDLAREQKLETMAARNDALLQMYRAHRPYREPMR